MNVTENNNCKVAIFKLDTDDFEKYYNQKLNEHGCTVFPLSEFICQNSYGKRSELKVKKYWLLI